MDNGFLSNVYGYSKVKKELRLIREWYLNSDTLGERKRLLPKGILFYGEPGEGKTHMVREYSKTFGYPVFVLEGNGDNALDEVVTTYKKAKETSGIVVVDEIDKLIQKDEKLTRVLMAQLDGFESGNNVLTLATCNNYDDLPEALLREGRFDRHFQMKVDNEKDLEDIIKGFSSDAGINLSTDDLSELEDSLSNLSPSAIRGVFNNAALRFGNKCDIDDVMNTISFLKTGFVNSSKDIEVNDYSAVHEAGHALYLYKYSKTMKFLRVYFDEEKGCTTSKNIDQNDSLEHRIEMVQAGLAGVVAEEIIFKKHDVGCASDLEKVHNISFRLLNRTCINGVDLYCSFHSFFSPECVSEKNKAIFDEKTSKFIRENYKKVMKILKKDRGSILLIANYLKKNKQIRRDTFVELLEGASRKQQ